MHAFLCHETNFFCVSTTSGLLHDVFQLVSVHPIPIEICYGLLSYTKTPNCLCVVLILCMVWMCADGASSCPPYKCLRTYLHKSLLSLPQVYENAKLLVCCADSLFGLDVRRRCVVLSSLQVPPHFFTQKSALSTSDTPN